jgi:CHAT domain-containing protein/tetratricopeptide (TPR) repeat protein
MSSSPSPPAPDSGLEYAAEQARLGIHYCQLSTGDPAANLAQAIACFTEALRFRTPEAAPLDYARTKRSLGNAYAALPGPDRPANLRRAIDCYTEALRFGTAEAAPADYARTQYNLGNAYARMPTGDREATLRQAIASYTEALRFLGAETDPGLYALILTNLGNANAELPTEDRAANLRQAITYYTEALQVATPETDPAQYVRVQTNRGNTYLALLDGERAANLKEAIACYTEALRFTSAETTPLDYAFAQHALGNAYWALPIGDRAANLDRAITCHKEALRCATPEVAPGLYGMIQNNLGFVYEALPTGDRAANLKLAIACYAEALRFRTAESAPRGYAITQTNLGNAYAALPGLDRAANLKRAIACYTEALKFINAENAPHEYADIQNDLGSAYWARPTGDRAVNLERAIACFTEALRFRTAEAAPFRYATTQTNLGNAYAALPGLDRAANLERAIACYTEALRFRTAETAPAECRSTAGHLGSSHLQQDQWAAAHSAYSLAIRASEFLYRATGSEPGRQAELGAAGNAVAADAYCLARLGRTAEAVQRLEAGRARALGEALARDRVALAEASETDQAAFAAAAEQIRTLETEGRHRQDTGAPPVEGQPTFAQWSADLVRAREDLAAVIDRIRDYVPGFIDEGLGYPEIAATAQPERPLVYLLTTPRGGLALVVPAGAQGPAPQDAIWFDSFTSERLDRLLAPRDSAGEVHGYLAGQLTGDLDQLAAAVTGNLAVLSRELLGPLAARLAELGAAAATVVPVGRLSLLPLAAAAPDGLTIALAPSARILRVASGVLRERSGRAPVLLAAGNPVPHSPKLGALDYAGLEIRTIERFFAAGSRRILPEEAATRTAVIQALPGATHLHLACHGGFDPNEPLNSALHLAGEDQLTLRDLLDGDLDLSSQRLAVLSACQTGITEFERVPDEVIGLPAGFLQAGVPGVVATLWSVNDQSTAVLMAEFYRLLLAEQKDPAAALDSARRYLRDATASELAEWFEARYEASGGTDLTAFEAAVDSRRHPDPADRPYADPVYWAGFVYFGP